MNPAAGQEAAPPTGPDVILLIGPGDNRADCAAVRACGLRPLVDPYLESAACADPSGALELVGALTASDGWVVVASPRAYPSWSRLVGSPVLLHALESSARLGWRGAAVGAASAATLPHCGWGAVIVGEPQNARGLIGALGPHGPARAVIPQSEIARPDLVAGLQALGWEVIARPVYRTVTTARRPASAPVVANAEVAAIVLRSPSAVAALLCHTTPSPRVLLVAGGDTTAAAARAAGLEVLVSDSPEPAAVAAAVRAGLTNWQR